MATAKFSSVTPEGDDGALPQREALHLLRQRQRHQRIADIDDEHGGKQHRQARARGDEVGAGKLPRARKVAGGNEDGEPQRKAPVHRPHGVRERDGHIPQGDGQPVFDAFCKFHKITQKMSRSASYYSTNSPPCIIIFRAILNFCRSRFDFISPIWYNGKDIQ